MDRFVVMIWDEHDQGRRPHVDAWSETLERKSSNWLRVLDHPGLRVYAYRHRGDAPIVTSWDDGEGVVLGVLFGRGRERLGRIRKLPRAETRRIIETLGKTLARDYWGNFVGIWRDASNARVCVLRDACGAVPCLMTSQRGIDLLFAHVEDVVDFQDLRLSIDWTFLQAYLLFNYFVTRHTGLKEVTELLPGERIDRKSGVPSNRAFVWDGALVAAQVDKRNFADSCVSIRETAESCFTAWGSEYGNIVVSLSGGLDSSVLINLLRRVTNAHVTGVHYLGLDYEHYEVTLARAAAAQAQVDLIEVVQDPKQDNVQSILSMPRMARPKVQALAVLIDELSSDVARQAQADCFMIGQGGDNIFLQRGGAKHTLADYITLNPLGLRTLDVAYAAATLQRQSIWEALVDALSQRLSPNSWSPFANLDTPEWVQHKPLSPSAIAAIPEAYKVHPWYKHAARLPPGKADHLVNIVSLNNYYIHHGRGIERDVSYPFYSQPLVETALRTPTYILAQGGRDRAIERAAFDDLIPPAISRRSGKGGANHYLLQVMAHNFDFYRELLRNGSLRKQGLVDGRKLEKMLGSEFVTKGAGALFLYQLVAAEAWTQSWSRNTKHHAA